MFALRISTPHFVNSKDVKIDVFPSLGNTSFAHSVVAQEAGHIAHGDPGQFDASNSGTLNTDATAENIAKRGRTPSRSNNSKGRLLGSNRRAKSAPKIRSSFLAFNIFRPQKADVIVPND
jgi:hypothetical protein